MDYVTRQFIFLTKKFRKELRKYQETSHRDLARLADSLKNLKDAISTNQKTAETSNDTPPVTKAELSTEIPIRVQTETKHSKAENVWRVIKGAFEIAGIIAVILYTGVSYQNWLQQIDATNFTGRQTKYARQSLNESTKNFTVAQRAWVGALVELVVPRPTGTPENMIAFRVVWKNTGATPALHTRVTPGIMYQERKYLFDSGFENAKFLNTVDKVSDGIVVPGGYGYGPIFYVPAPLPKKWLFIAGTITYKDIFGSMHKTEVCHRLDKDTLPFCNVHNTMD